MKSNSFCGIWVAIIFSLFIHVDVFSQDIEVRLLSEGVELHRQGDYQGALAKYEQVLEINPFLMDAYYERALTYMEMQEFDKVIENTNVILSRSNELHEHAYIAQASAYDYQGNTDKSIEILERAISEGLGTYLVYYNLAYNYFSLLNMKKAEENAINAIKVKNDHASSHLLLASINIDANEYIKGIIGLYYFLLLEPTSVRSKNVFELLLMNLSKGEKFVEETQAYDGIHNFLVQKKKELLFTTSETFNKDEFTDFNFALFGLIGVKKFDKGDIYSDMYITFIKELNTSPYVFAYSHYISQIMSEYSYKWCLEQPEKISNLNTWIKNNYPKWEYKQ